MNKKLMPCAYCGDTNTKIIVCDGQGNIRGDLGCDYEKNPLPRGRFYRIMHHSGETECYLDTGEPIGWLYDTEEKAAKVWNTRHESFEIKKLKRELSFANEEIEFLDH